MSEQKKALLLLVAPGALGLVSDLAMRTGHFLKFGLKEALQYLLFVLLSTMLWGALLLFVAKRKWWLTLIASVPVVCLIAAVFGVQRYFFSGYNSYVDIDAFQFGLKFFGGVKHEVSGDHSGLVRAVLPPVLSGVACLIIAHRTLEKVELPKATNWVAGIGVVVALVMPVPHKGLQPATPDLIGMHALTRTLVQTITGGNLAAQVKPGRRSPEYIGKMNSSPPRQRNLVIMINESLRFDSVCNEYDKDCKYTPRMNAAAPNRIPFQQMRALDSATLISVPVILAGIIPTVSYEEMHSAPTIWEYAEAAGWESTYWTSQNWEWNDTAVFLRGVDNTKFIFGKDLDVDANQEVGAYDQKLADYFAEQFPKLVEPFVVIVQLCNTHFPYLIDENEQPFQPAGFEKYADGNEKFFNYYHNSVYHQDRWVAQIINTVRQSEVGKRTIITYTADHGEAFREHNQLAHTFSQYDEEVKVPAWIDAPKGTLTDEEEKNLRSLRDVPLSHADLLPTFLDLMGVWDAPEITRRREKMRGQSMLRGEREFKELPMTNCAALWTCPFKNYGIMKGWKKLHAREWDTNWRCYDLKNDPFELQDLGPAGCDSLATDAKKYFPELPSGGSW